MAVASLALFLAVHLYVPSMSFVVFCMRMTDPSSVLFTTVTRGRPLFLKLQYNVGIGTPAVTLQLMLAALRSGTVWLAGDTTT